MSDKGIDELINRCTRHGWRCLAVIIGDIDLDLSFINGNNLCISKNGVEETFDLFNVKCNSLADFATAHKIIGSEHDNVFLSLRETRGWPGNLIALSMEFVNKGGIYALFVPEKLSNTRFGKYFIREVLKSDNYVLISREGIKYKFYSVKPSLPIRREHIVGDKIIKKLLDLAINDDQCRALKTLPSFLYSKHYKMLLVHGDRGRGKSGVLGLMAAYIIARNKGKYIVTSRKLEGVQSFFKTLVLGLDKLEIKYDVIKRDNLICSVQSTRGTVSYSPPWRIQLERINKPLFVDEAASVGLARIRRWYIGFGKLIASTTIHGYEGSGRALLRYVNEYFRRTVIVKLRTPIRYYPGDPLEKTMYKIFHLDAEPPEIKEISIEQKNIKYNKHAPDILAGNYRLLRNIYGLLVTAHYRNEPDDLVLMLDTDYFEIVSQDIDNELTIGVAQLRSEEYSYSLEPHDRSTLLINVLSRIINLSRITDKLKILRIVRIAVTPPLQRKGYGSKLLSFIEEEAMRRKYDCVGAIFSGFETLFFWLKNRYYPVYISPRYNRATGEKNIAVLKPLSSDGRKIAGLASSILLQKILHSGHIVYRDVGLEKIDAILNFMNDMNIKLPDISIDCMRLDNYVKNLEKMYYENIVDIIHKYLHILDLYKLDDLERRMLIGRVVQGKTIVELSKIYKLSPEKIGKIIEEISRGLAVELYEKLCSKN